MKTAPISVTYIDHCGSDLSVVNAARVSFAKESKWEEFYSSSADEEDGVVSVRMLDRDKNLIHYLAKHKHTSPFNHCFLSFRVKAPVFVARQMVKHKFLPWNEVSRRYVVDDVEFYAPRRWRGMAPDKKQGSRGVVEVDEYEITKMPYEVAIEAYETLLVKGVAPEQARMVLPQALLTTWIWSGTLGAWCDMLRLRLSEYTQEETREVATLIADEVRDRFPVSYEALLVGGADE